ncbi:MAG: hypothetical protein SPI28_07505, partial [Acetatifactor sp.]|nr:hypothetical protein [Acetatifactor sp.]
MGIVARRKKTNPMLWIIPVVVLSLALLTIIIAVHVHAFQKRKSPEEGKQFVSVTEEITAKAYVWLEQIQDMKLSYPEVRDAVGDVEIQIQRVKKPDGEASVEVVVSSYEEAEESALDSLEELYRRVLTQRLKEAGYEGTCEQADLDRMMQEAYGV